MIGRHFIDLAGCSANPRRPKPQGGPLLLRARSHKDPAGRVGRTCGSALLRLGAIRKHANLDANHSTS